MWVLGAVLLCTALPFIVVMYRHQRNKYKMLDGNMPLENVVASKIEESTRKLKVDPNYQMMPGNALVDGGLQDDVNYYEYYLPPALREGLRGWSPTCGQGWVNWGVPRYSL